MKKILIIQAGFYEKISDMLLEGALAKLKDSDFEYDILKIPGCFEIPATIAMAEHSRKYSGYITLGCVIRGETTHYDYVCQESARGINQLAMQHKTAIGYGVITVENEAQAFDRADINKKDKGGFAAQACLEMMNIKSEFDL